MLNGSVTHKLRIAIVDDEQPARQSLRTMLAQLRPDCQVVGEADGVMTGVQLIRQHQPDIVLLDVAMDDGTGFDLLDLFPNLGFKVVFTTAYDQYALKAFRYNALDYLLKPILPRELIGSIDKVVQTTLENHVNQIKNLTQEVHSRQLSKLALPCQEGLVFLKLDQTIRLEADGNYTTLFAINKERYTVAQPLREFEEILPKEGFFRIHQTHIINYDFVKKLLKKDGGYVALEDGIQLPIARRRKDDFMKWLQDKDPKTH